MKKKLVFIYLVYASFISCNNNEQKHKTIIKHIIAYNYEGPIFWIAREKNPTPLVANDTIYINYIDGVAESGFVKTNRAEIREQYYYDNNTKVPFVTDTMRCGSSVGIVHSVIVRHSLIANADTMKQNKSIP